MKCRKDRVLIGVLVARERELHSGCTPFIYFFLKSDRQGSVRVEKEVEKAAEQKLRSTVIGGSNTNFLADWTVNSI